MQTDPNPLFRLLIWNWLAGAAAAVIVVGGLLATDTLRLRSLILDSSTPAVPLATSPALLISARPSAAIMLLAKRPCASSSGVWRVGVGFQKP